MFLLLTISTVLHTIAGETISPIARDSNINAADPTISSIPDVEITDFPYAVILESNKQVFCAGAILTNQYVITSDVCANRAKTYPNTTIRAGSSFVGLGGTEHTIAEIIIHDDYEKFYPHRSIGLLRVEKTFHWGDNTKRPVSLTYVDELVRNLSLHKVPGWGEVGNSWVSMNRLHTVDVQIYWYGNECEISGYKICARTIDQSMCHGDNGDPLVIDGSLAGVLSISEQPCDGESSKIAFVNLARYNNWIKSHVKSSSSKNGIAITVLLTSILFSCSKLFY
ncbi:hypothetical protein QAD02_016500 [Eretmocerus hayati]|uniref:Uncharacterized protein n=1 Tax=Eretmocerus hayati TaxID=131215 RepID=A0ACC2PC91_9HYME|nr:hypothetical protein QAD02_016500 [Eretmocerus hayati]